MHDETKIGVLGGGQLARMIMIAGSKMNYDLYFMDKNSLCSVSNVTKNLKIGNILNYDEVVGFGLDKDIITIESENINISALKYLQSIGKKIFPKPETLEIINDRGLQKIFFEQNNFKTAKYRLVYNQNEIERIDDFDSGVIKIRRVEPENKNNEWSMVIENIVLDGVINRPSVVEEKLDILKKLSIIGARNTKGEIAIYEPVDMILNTETHLLDYQFCPAQIGINITQESKAILKRLLEELDYVGVLTVELFLTNQNELLINGLSPRPHNSGHHTIEGSYTNQFEQLLRSINNLPLGPTNNIASTIMINLIGDDAKSLIPQILNIKGVTYHSYNKQILKNKKVGHITIINPNKTRLLDNANKIKKILDRSSKYQSLHKKFIENQKQKLLLNK